MISRKCFTSAFKTTVPIMLGYLTCGLAYGLIVINAGYPWYLATIMSLFMFAGAAQFAAIPLFAANTPLPVILITEALLNIRHIVYGLPLLSQFKQCGKRKPYLIYGLTDETWSLLITAKVPDGIPLSDYFTTITLLDHFYWVAGSTLGALIGFLIPLDLTGVDFALTALFAVLTIDQFSKFFSKDSAGTSAQSDGGAK